MMLLMYTNWFSKSAHTTLTNLNQYHVTNHRRFQGERGICWKHNIRDYGRSLYTICVHGSWLRDGWCALSLTQPPAESISPGMAWKCLFVHRHSVVRHSRACTFPKNCPFAWGDLDPHLIHGSFSPPESTTQTANRLVQPFLPRHVLCRAIWAPCNKCSLGPL